MDITIIIRKSLVYSLVIGLFTGLYLALLFFISNLISSIMGGLALRSHPGEGGQLLVTLLMLVAFALGFQPLKEYMQNKIDKIFFRGKYDYQKTLRDLSRAAVTIIDLADLLAYIFNIIKETVNPESIRVFIYNQYHGCYTEKLGTASEILEKAPLVEHLKNKKQPQVTEELAREADTKPELAGVIENLKTISAELCVPLFSRNKLIGLLALGNKQNQEIYNDEDINLLATLGNHLATSIENALLHEEAMQAQQKLIQADKLSSLGTMAAGLAHEIKNPLSMIKSLSQLVEPAFADKDESFIKEFKEIVPKQLDAINDLTENLLKFGQPQKAKLEPCGLNQVLKDSLRLFERQCRKKTIEIVEDLHPLPTIMADEKQLEHVFSNLIINAIDAMQMGGTLILRSRALPGRVGIEISDSGMGIPEANLKNIFDPFFTTKSQGTGLGLAVAYKIIQDHGANIEVESQMNKGTTFKVTFDISHKIQGTSNKIQTKQQ